MFRALAIATSIAASGCATTYHPEYHPEIRYSYVQNVTYGVPENTNRCKLGLASECWNECFARTRGEACYVLSVMFETGNGVPRRRESSERLAAIAARMGYEPAAIDATMAAPYIDLWRHDASSNLARKSREPDAPQVRSEKGVVVVYGSINGDVVFEK